MNDIQRKALAKEKFPARLKKSNFASQKNADNEFQWLS